LFFQAAVVHWYAFTFAKFWRLWHLILTSVNTNLDTMTTGAEEVRERQCGAYTPYGNTISFGTELSALTIET